MILSDFRMHRACPDRTTCFAGFRFRGWLQIFFRISDEFAAAAGTAKVIGLPDEIGVVGGSSEIDCHTADGIVDLAGRRTLPVAGQMGTGGLFGLVVQLKFLEPDGRAF